MSLPIDTVNSHPFLNGGGEMGQLIRNFDWSKTSLGPANTWPQSLRTTLGLLLNARLPMGLWWGEDFIQFYNDAYRPCLGMDGKHPLALGQRGPDCWPEAWPMLEPLINQVTTGGQAIWQEEVLIPIYRNGAIENAYWTFSYSPVRDETDRVAGVMVLCQDTTRQVETLRLSGQRFRNFVHQATVGIIVLSGEDMVVELVNDAYGRLIDRTHDTLLNRPLFSVIPEAKPHFYPILEKVRLTGEALYLHDYPYFVMVNGVRKEGFLDLVYQPYREVDGNITGVMVLCHEVTDKIVARKKVEESEEKYRGLFETMDQGFCIIDMIFDANNRPVDYRIVENNPVFEKQSGLKDPVGKTASELVPELEDRWFEIYGKVASTGEATRFVEGSQAMGRWFEVFAFRLGGTGSQRVAVLFTDITQRKEAEAELQASEAHFRTFADNIQNLAWMANPDGWIYWYNQRWYEYTGTNPEEMQGWGWEKVHHPDHLGRVVNFVKEAWQKGETFELIFPLKGAHGDYRWFLTRAYAVKDAEGQIVRWIGTNTDIDDQKRAEVALAEREKEAQALAEELVATNEEIRVANNQIQASNQELGLTNAQLTRINADLENFVYTASHDLKAPISNLEGLQRLLLERLKDRITDEERVMIGYMRQATEKLNRTIKDLAEIAKIQSETGELELLSFRDLLGQVSEDLAPLITESSAQIEVDLSVEHIHLPRKHLRSILYNLLSNAIKYRSPDRVPRVKITTRKEGDSIVLTVQDNGLGLDSSQQGKLFQLFRRLHMHVEGTGVGLYMVKRTVENNGGRIEVQSQPGVGTMFRVSFP